MNKARIPLTPAQVSMVEIEIEDCAHDDDREPWWPVLNERRTGLIVSVDHVTETTKLFNLGEEYERSSVSVVTKLMRLRSRLRPDGRADLLSEVVDGNQGMG